MGYYRNTSGHGGTLKFFKRPKSKIINLLHYNYILPDAKRLIKHITTKSSYLGKYLELTLPIKEYKFDYIKKYKKPPKYQ